MKTVLIIDDDPIMRRGVATALGREGFDVVEAQGGREALRLIDQAPPALVVTDINMPEMDGIEVIMEMTKLERSIPVVAISGGGCFTKELLLDNAQFMGAVRTIAKPFELGELVDAVRTALASGRGAAAGPA